MIFKTEDHQKLSTKYTMSEERLSDLNWQHCQ